jgi:S-DNA-T family DNA segregation ATPase FtsK/SpoIIIE
MPESGIRGRGLACYGNRILEYQTALSIEAENDYQRMEDIKQQCMEMKKAWTKKRARKIPEIPEKPVLSLFEELEDFEKMSMDPYYLPIGYDAANAQVYGIPLRDTYCYLIWGAKRTGKTNLLKVCIQAAMKKESQICIIDSPDRNLQTYEKMDDITYVTKEEEIFQFFGKLLPVFKQRNQLKQQMIA